MTAHYLAWYRHFYKKWRGLTRFQTLAAPLGEIMRGHGSD